MSTFSDTIIETQHQYQLVSDIHLEFCGGKFPKVNKVSPNLILAGDIGVISDIESYDVLIGFIRQCCSRWTHIFYVLGNHEYYHCIDMSLVLIKFREDTKTLSNFHLLDGEYFIHNDIAIYGFTAWTIPSAKTRRYFRDLCDFDEIHINGSNLSLNDMEKIGKEGIIKFREFIDKVNSNEIECKAVIIITHFPPVREGTSAPKYIGDDLNDYFSWRNLLVSENITCNKIKVWGSGHTHWSYDFIRDGIKFIANQYGYPFEHLDHNSGFFEIKLFEPMMIVDK